jgi:hypothetical protein
MRMAPTPQRLAPLGIEVRPLDIDIEGDLDLHGFLGLSSEVRPGCDTIRVRYPTDRDATPDEVDELTRHVRATSPVLVFGTQAHRCGVNWMLNFDTGGTA